MVIKEKQRPVFPAGTPPAYLALAQRCWSELPEARPGLAEVEEALAALQGQMCPGGQQHPWPLVPGKAPEQRKRSKDISEAAGPAKAAEAPAPVSPSAGEGAVGGKGAAACQASSPEDGPAGSGVGGSGSTSAQHVTWGSMETALNSTSGNVSVDLKAVVKHAPA